ncbi:hypothetical protein LTR94_032635, partial [Friedmanniomyces endolithicus]
RAAGGHPDHAGADHRVRAAGAGRGGRGHRAGGADHQRAAEHQHRAGTGGDFRLRAGRRVAVGGRRDGGRRGRRRVHHGRGAKCAQPDERTDFLSICGARRHPVAGGGRGPAAPDRAAAGAAHRPPEGA